MRPSVGPRAPAGDSHVATNAVGMPATPLLKAFAPVTRGVNPPDANPFIGRGELLEILPGGGVGFQTLEDIGGKCGPTLARMLDGRQARVGHAAGLDQPPHALAIHVGQPAGLSSRRVALRVLVLVDRLQDAVDPAVTERLVDGVVVSDAGLAARLLIVDQPDLPRRRVVLRQPASPLFVILCVQRFADLHWVTLIFNGTTVVPHCNRSIAESASTSGK